MIKSDSYSASRPKAVAITGLQATDNPAPGIAVAKSIRQGGYDGLIIGLTYDTYDTGSFDKDIVDQVYLIPYPNTGAEVTLDRIHYINSRVKLDAIIPNLDSELDLYNSIRDDLTTMGIGTFIPDLKSLRMRSKARLVEFCSKNDLPVPITETVTDLPSLDRAIARTGFPAVIKGVFYEAYIAHSWSEAVIYFEKLRAKWGIPIMVQNMIPGEEYNVCAVGDGKGNLIGAVPMRKLRLTEKGKAWAGITIRDNELLELSRRVIEALQWRGPCELELMRHEQSGMFYLIEINPRFPSWCYLTTGSGQNLPYANLQLALGQDPGVLPNYRSGVTFARHAVDIICELDALEGLIVHGEVVYRDDRAGHGEKE